VTRARAAATDALAHPRHLVLFAFTAGLLAAPLPPAAVLALAIGAAALVLVAGGMAGADGVGAGAAAGAGDGAGEAATVATGTPRPRGPALRAGPALAGAAARTGLALAVAAALLGGAVAGRARLDATSGARLVALSGQSLRTEATILEPVRKRGAGPAVARVKLAGGDQAVMRTRSSGPWPGVGEVVALEGRVAPLGAYDAYQRARGAAAAIEVRSLRRTGRRRGGLMGLVDVARRRAERAIDGRLAPADAALMRGMVLGQDDRLDAEEKLDFQRSGLAHLLAASGANVMLLATLVLGISALTGLPRRARLVAALVLVAFYIPLAGGGPSIQRAGVMGAAGLVAGLAGRPSSRWYAFGLAAAVTLLLNPRSPADVGWQLSFAAVLALIALAPPLRDALARRLPGWLAEATAITTAATLGTAPLLALAFEQVSLASLPANLVVAPAVAPIMWIGMLAAAVAQVSPAMAVPLAALAGPLLGFVAHVAHAAAAAPLAVLPVRLHSPPAVAALFGVTAGAGALLRRASVRAAERPLGAPLRLRPAVLAVAVALIPGGLVVTHRHVPPTVPGELIVSFLDIGQGDATLLQHGGASILVDTGPPDGQVVRRLREAGVRRLDLLVLTHAQLDHEGAALPVVRAFAPRLLVDGGAGWPTPTQRALPAAMRAAGTRELDARAGQEVDLAGIRLEVLWPPAAPPGWRPVGDPNNRAVVALARLGTFDLLLTADAESDVTAALRLPPVDVLKVAHHGSADIGLPALLARLHPTVAAIEVGRHNDYGHPAASTIAALRAAVPTVVRTDLDGTVRLRVTGNTMRLERHA
jgi:competence protein ComEC